MRESMLAHMVNAIKDLSNQIKHLSESNVTHIEIRSDVYAINEIKSICVTARLPKWHNHYDDDISGAYVFVNEKTGYYFDSMKEAGDYYLKIVQKLESLKMIVIL